MSPEQQRLQSLLPQRPPMILLDAILDCDTEAVSSRVGITPQSPFFDAALGGVPAWVGIEYLAQTIAAWAGHQQILNGLPVKVCFLVGGRSYRSNRPVFENGQQLRITIRPVFEDDNGLGAFDCTLHGDKGLQAQGQIKVFRTQTPKAFVRPAA